jgi:predicted RecA/RadA family phage recombinase
MKNYVQKGESLAATLAVAVVSGQFVQLGNGKLAGVAQGTYAANVEGQYQTEGVVQLPAAAAATGVVGDIAYWDAAALNVTATSAGNTKIGAFAAVKLANDVTANVKLNEGV